MRLYFGSTALLLATGIAIGATLGWALTRWYFIRVLRGIQRRVGQAKRIHYAGMEYIDPGDDLQAELWRRRFIPMTPEEEADWQASRPGGKL